ncbi:MAG: isoprenylcysteine carboxylmethyltransferase family protein [Oscillospiraceae bacterium]
MDDPKKFSDMAEYRIFLVALLILFLFEFAVWIITSKGKRDHSRKQSDKGTVWLIIIGWCISLPVGALFRSQDAPVSIRSWLLPHFCYDIGIVFMIVGILIRGMSIWKLKKAFTFSVQTTQDQHLIQTGLYRIVRNPAYTGSMLSLLGVAFAYRHILGVVAVFVICFLCYGIRICVEEKALSSQFGQEFEKYCNQTRFRLIPGIY